MVLCHNTYDPLQNQAHPWRCFPPRLRMTNDVRRRGSWGPFIPRRMATVPTPTVVMDELISLETFTTNRKRAEK